MPTPWPRVLDGQNRHTRHERSKVEASSEASSVTEAGSELPGFVRREFERFAHCGDLNRGFMYLSCTHCGHQLFVPFSCKSRSICASCMGRRMSETTALLVDHLLPAAPYRHITLTFAGPLALRLTASALVGQRSLALCGPGPT